MRGVLQRQSLAEVGSGSKQQVWAPEVPLPSGRTSLSEVTAWHMLSSMLAFCVSHQIPARHFPRKINILVYMVITSRATLAEGNHCSFTDLL